MVVTIDYTSSVLTGTHILLAIFAPVFWRRHSRHDVCASSENSKPVSGRILTIVLNF